VALAVSLEVHPKRTFAWALDWPGWCRSGKTEEAALEALAGYADRYRPVAERAGLKLGARAARDLEVIERLPGDATTAFGAPRAVGERDHDPLTARQAQRHADLVEAAWAVLAGVAASAPAELRKGPRGGGRDRDKIVEHVATAEFSYARKLEIRHKAPDPVTAEASAALRAEVLERLRAARGGDPPGTKGWPPRYLARRIAWHALDHAWEIEDRREPAG
jgi:hypothetical protein